MLLGFSALLWGAAFASVKQLAPFVGETGCSAYWSFVLDAKRSGISADDVQRMYTELDAPRQFSVTQTCGSVADAYARMP